MDITSLSNVAAKPPIGHHVRSTHPGNSFHHHLHHPGNTSLPQLPHAIVISGLENTATSSQRALAQVLVEKRFFLDAPLDDLRPQDTRQETETWHLPDGFIAVYVCPINPRERPNIHNALVRRFIQVE
jgi:hypothetical protein